MGSIELENGLYYVAGSRVALASILEADRAGESAEAICEAFPVLHLDQVHRAIAFSQANPAEVDAYLHRLDAAFDQRRRCQAPLPDSLTKQLLTSTVAGSLKQH